MPTPLHFAKHPNILYILLDDLGYGDVSHLNEKSKIQTPHMDRLAREGMTFSDAHSGSAVCTPTRYGVITGRYAWRTHLRTGVLWGYSQPLIAPGRVTVASLLGEHGYHTACLGKWHLGMDWPFRDPAAAGSWNKGTAPMPDIDYSRPINSGPLSCGFDHYFGISASLDMPPYCWIEGNRAVGIPNMTKELFPGRVGAATKDFEAVDVLPTLGARAVSYVESRQEHAGPFFLYLSLNSPHTPIVPSKEFKGRSGVNDYADFVMQTDAIIGEVLEALDRTGQAKNTLVIVTADNGCSPEADFETLAAHGHHPSYIYRGAKADIFDGGHRVPFLARWPGQIKRGSSCDQPVCLTDLLATCAEIVGTNLPDHAGEDSVSMLPHLWDKQPPSIRAAVVHQSINGSLAIREGRWKLEICPDSGGWSHPKPGQDDIAGLPRVQLYDMERDAGERTNLHETEPALVARLTALLQSYIDDGRSTPGASQPNDVPVPMQAPPKRINVRKEGT